MASLRTISPSDPITRLALEGFEASAPVALDLDLYTRTGSADSLKTAREAETPASIFRSLNEANTATGPTPNYDPITKKIVSFDATVDVILEDRNEDTEAELAQQLRLKAKEAGWIFQEKFFEGDDAVDAESFDGLRNLVNASWEYDVATDGIVLQVGDSDDAVSAQMIAIEELLKLIDMVRGGASHLYMNNLLQIRFLTIAKHLNYYQQSKDELGNLVDTINGVVIRKAGRKKNGTMILPFSETTGGSTNCSSIFAVRWGERENLTALTSVGMKARDAGQIGNLITYNVNMDFALALQDPTALVQSKGWRLSAS